MKNIDAKRMAKAVVKTANNANKHTHRPYDTSGVVKRVEGSTVYVQFNGADEVTPVSKTINCRLGDNVKIRISDRKAWIIGNVTAPPTDDTVANKANKRAKNAQDTAKSAEETAIEADETATDAKETAEAILVYDHTYEIDEQTNTAHFTAFLYQGGIDVKTKYREDLFTWALKTESGEEPLGYGYTMDVDIDDCGYGAEIIGRFNASDGAELLDDNNSNLSTSDNQPLTVRADGEKIRVRDLEVVTTIYSTEKLMVIGANDEHLVTMDTLATYLGGIIDSDKHFEYVQATPSDTWEIEHNLGKEPSVSVVDSAGTSVEGDCEYINANKIIISFSSAFSGKAYLN